MKSALRLVSTKTIVRSLPVNANKTPQHINSLVLKEDPCKQFTKDPFHITHICCFQALLYFMQIHSIVCVVFSNVV